MEEVVEPVGCGGGGGEHVGGRYRPLLDCPRGRPDVAGEAIDIAPADPRCAASGFGQRKRRRERGLGDGRGADGRDGLPEEFPGSFAGCGHAPWTTVASGWSAAMSFAESETAPNTPPCIVTIFNAAR
ncbi:MAG: hypothetical protein AMXMBFR80_11670 [Dehalococcoidia bacterium]